MVVVAGVAFEIVTAAGLKVAVAPGGKLLALRLTTPVKPSTWVTVTVYV
jgi:hypothetical protein